MPCSRRDLVDAVLDRREHPEPEQVDLEEAGVRAGVLVPLAHLPSGHRGGLHGDELHERPRRDHHPARMLGDVTRQAGDLVAELTEGAPARRQQLAVCVGELLQLLGDALRVPAFRDAGDPLELRVRKAERLADVADRAARAVRRERCDECRVLASVALGDGDDQLLANVAREVEVDVRNRVELAVQEAAERELGADRVDVREAGEVADERADGRAAPASRGSDVSRRVAPAHFERAFARELEHVPVQQEEACEPELVDQLQLLFESRARFAAELVTSRVAVLERAIADVRAAARSRARDCRRSRGTGSRAPR